MARWGSVDPLAGHPNQVDKSAYAYAWNNPVKFDDPDGKCPDCVWDALNIVYDLGKITYGAATSNPKIVSEGAFDLIADIASLMIPGVPAGSTKVARKLAHDGVTKILKSVDSKAIRAEGEFSKGMADAAGINFLGLNTKVLEKNGVKSIQDLAKMSKKQQKKAGISKIQFDKNGKVKGVIGGKDGQKRYRPASDKDDGRFDANFDTKKTPNTTWDFIDNHAKGVERDRYRYNTHAAVKK